MPIAHNAAFDMRFLQLKEAATGVVFDQPVLDTPLLSAVVHPNQESHSLEGEIAARFDVAILGPTPRSATRWSPAEVFLKMIPLLAEKGIVTLGPGARGGAEDLLRAGRVTGRGRRGATAIPEVCGAGGHQGPGRGSGTAGGPGPEISAWMSRSSSVCPL